MPACDSCGAALAPGADACDLCGTPAALGAPADESAWGGDAPTCPRCGHRPPAGSRFCNRCGEPLVASAAPPTVAASRERPPSDAGKRGMVIAGVGLLAVVALYAATVLAGGSDADLDEVPASDVADVGEAAPVPEGTPPLPDSLQAAADAFAAQDTAEGWFESGRYYLTAAFRALQVEPADPVASVQFARRAVSDFERSLALEESVPVRVALAEAATFDPSTPMRPVQELQAVLAVDPDNVDATFLLGERRRMIGRTDSARAAFERVVELAPPGALVRQRAEEALADMAATGETAG